ncbi:DEDD2 protein, partial [Ifrita kowaldi]|nr:DEDD2 protein [Ifrita kowaldi]
SPLTVESLRALSQLHSPRGAGGDGGRPGERRPGPPMARTAWDEEECLDYYGMLSLHRLFEVVGAQLTPSDVAVLSFLLDETLPGPHPLDPALWGGDSGPSPALLERWGRRREARVGAGPPRNGLELLLEMERRGLCHEGDFGHLRQLLRLVTRHDLLRCVTLKRPRPVSPERVTCVPAMGGTCPSPPRPRPEHWETGEGWG